MYWFQVLREDIGAQGAQGRSGQGNHHRGQEGVVAAVQLCGLMQLPWACEVVSCCSRKMPSGTGQVGHDQALKVSSRTQRLMVR